MVSLKDQYQKTTNRHENVASLDAPLIENRSPQLLEAAYSDFCEILRRTTAPPAFSIIIPARDAFGLLAFCLRGISRQSYLRRVRGDLVQVIVVVDDGADSKQDYAIQFTAGSLGDIVSDLRHTGVSITVTRDDSNNRGRGGARNLGVSLAKHPFLVFLDDSVVMSENFLLDHAYRHHHARGRIALLGFKTEVSKDDFDLETLLPRENARTRPDWKLTKPLQLEAGDTPFYFEDVEYEIGATVEYMKLTKYLDGLSGAVQLGNRHLATFFQTNATSVPRAAVRDAGGFPEFYTWGLEDTALGVGLVASGCTLVPCPSSTAYSLSNESDEKRDAQWKSDQMTESRRLYQDHISRTLEDARRRAWLSPAPPSISRLLPSDHTRYVGKYSTNIHGMRGPYEERLPSRLKWLNDVSQRIRTQCTQRCLVAHITTSCTPLDEVRLAYKRKWDMWYSSGSLQSGEPRQDLEADAPAVDRFVARSCCISCIVPDNRDIDLMVEIVRRALGESDHAATACEDVANALLMTAMRPGEKELDEEHVIVQVWPSAKVVKNATSDLAARVGISTDRESTRLAHQLALYRERQTNLQNMPLDRLLEEPLSAEALSSYVARAPSQFKSFGSSVAASFRREVSPLWLQHMLYGLHLARAVSMCDVHNLATTGEPHTRNYIASQRDGVGPAVFRNATDLVSKCLIFSNARVIGDTYPLMPSTREWMNRIWGP